MATASRPVVAKLIAIRVLSNTGYYQPFHRSNCGWFSSNATNSRWQVSDFGKQSEIEADLIVSGTERRFSAEVELILFRIVQEALRNVEKHAQASRVEVKIEFGEGKTKVSISDNGKGFDLRGSLADLPRAGKLGLAGMEERVHLLNGSMKIESEPHKGTRVMVEVPI